MIKIAKPVRIPAKKLVKSNFRVGLLGVVDGTIVEVTTTVVTLTKAVVELPPAAGVVKFAAVEVTA